MLTFPQGRHVRVVKVLDLGARRGPAPEARLLYEDLKPPSPEGRLPTPAARPRGGGRPTKQERRALDRLREKTYAKPGNKRLWIFTSLLTQDIHQHTHELTHLTKKLYTDTLFRYTVCH